MRAAVERALVACAIAAVMACSPETEPASPSASQSRPGVGAGGASGNTRAGSGGRLQTQVSSAGQAGVSAAIAVAAPPPPSAADPATPPSSPPAAQPEPNPGPTTALARIEPLARKPVSGNAGAMATTNPSAPTSGVAHPLPEQPSAELCDTLKKATGARPALPNDRLFALLAACSALQPSAAGAAAMSSSGSAGKPANAGDLPTSNDPRAQLAATAVFTHAADGISLVLVLDGCKDGAAYPVRIHAGHSCADESGIGDHWDRTRGDDIPDLRCNGAHASEEYVRSHTADKPWTLGGPSVSDVIGHALVLGDPGDRSLPIACGVVTAP